MGRKNKDNVGELPSDKGGVERLGHALERQLNDIAEQIENLSVDIRKDDDDRLVDLFVKLAEKGDKLRKNIDFMMTGEAKESGDGEAYDYEKFKKTNPTP